MKTKTDTTILDCGHTPTQPHSSFTPGYGVGPDGATLCYACCAAADRATMLREGRITLYLVGREVTNWPGSLRFPVGDIRTGRHNIARTRTDAWFVGPDGKRRHAVNYGHTSQIAHCTRTK